MKKKLKKFIVSFSYGERRKKEYEEYQKKRDSLKAMPKEELLYEYARINTEYSYQKKCFYGATYHIFHDFPDFGTYILGVYEKHLYLCNYVRNWWYGNGKNRNCHCINGRVLYSFYYFSIGASENERAEKNQK